MNPGHFGNTNLRIYCACYANAGTRLRMRLRCMMYITCRIVYGSIAVSRIPFPPPHNYSHTEIQFLQL